jgi:two-component system sensor histidine kinase BaeS
MRLSLTQQFVVAAVALALAVLLTALLLGRWSFQRGFSSYIDALETQRLEEVGEALLPYYSATRGWADLDRRAFFRALRTHPPVTGRAQREPPRRGPAVPTALYDAQGRPVIALGFGEEPAGRRDSPVKRHPLVLDGDVIGELRSLPARRLQFTQEARFTQQQRRGALLILFASAILALGAAMLLAGRLLAPLRRAHAALGRLAAGDYGQRMHSDRRDELGLLMSDIDRLAETLDSNRDARRRWLADISHELRTPIAVLKGELEAMGDGLRPFDASQLQSLQDEADRLARLVDDLYQLSLADLGGLRYEFGSVDLRELLEEARQAVATRVETAGLELQWLPGDACELRGDRQRLGQLLRNLLENSLAYTDAPGVIRVTLERGDAACTLTLEDSAPGVPDAECQQLFEPLYRRDASRSRHSAGAGLGLAICRAVVEAHGGTITAQPSSLGGLAIRVSLPMQGS